MGRPARAICSILSILATLCAASGVQAASDYTHSAVRSARPGRIQPHATPAQVESFFTTMAPLAQAEQAQYGVPASLALAVAADETGYGTNVFSQQNNDYFNVTCGANGADYTESPRATGVVYNGSYCYLTFADAADAFLDFGYFLTHDRHYTNLPTYFGAAPDVDTAIAALYGDGYAGLDNIATVQAIRAQSDLAQYDGAQPPPGTCTLTTCVIDENDPGFSWTGPITTPVRNDQTLGYEGHSFWSSNCGPGQTSDCTGGTAGDVVGAWTANLPQAGQYEVDVAIPASHATTDAAVYTIHASGGQVFTTTLDQDAYPPAGSPAPYAWAPLGVWSFDAGTGDAVALSDFTGEPYATKHVAWDALRFVPAPNGVPTTATPFPLPAATATAIAAATATATITGTPVLTTTPTVTPTATVTPTVVTVTPPQPAHLTVVLRMPRNNLCTTAPLLIRVRDKAHTAGSLALTLTRRVTTAVKTKGKTRHVTRTVVYYKRKVRVRTDGAGAAWHIATLPCLFTKPAHATLTVTTHVGHDAARNSVPLLIFKKKAATSAHTSHRTATHRLAHTRRT